MKSFLVCLLVVFSGAALGQRINQVPDTLRKPLPDQRDKTTKIVQEDGQGNVTADDVVKEHLVKIALRNPAFVVEDANIRIAELNRKKAGASWLGSISLGGNVNEFVISNPKTASFFPKYNAGVTIPLDIFSKVRNEKRVADQNIIIAKANKELKESEIRAETLVRYESYKEKADLVTLQNITLSNFLSDYQLAQKNFEDGSITIDVLNKIYQNYMMEKSRLISYKKDLNVAVIQLEEILGMPLKKAAPGLIVE